MKKCCKKELNKVIEYCEKQINNIIEAHKEIGPDFIPSTDNMQYQNIIDFIEWDVMKMEVD